MGKALTECFDRDASTALVAVSRSTNEKLPSQLASAVAGWSEWSPSLSSNRFLYSAKSSAAPSKSGDRTGGGGGIFTESSSARRTLPARVFVAELVALASFELGVPGSIPGRGDPDPLPSADAGSP